MSYPYRPKLQSKFFIIQVSLNLFSESNAKINVENENKWNCTSFCERKTIMCTLYITYWSFLVNNQNEYEVISYAINYLLLGRDPGRWPRARHRHLCRRRRLRRRPLTPSTPTMH